MRVQRIVVGLAWTFALVAVVGCEPEKPKAAGEGGSPPPVDSEADKNPPPRPTPPPDGKSSPMGPPKRGGAPMPG